MIHEFREFDAYAEAIRGADVKLVADRCTERLWMLGHARLGSLSLQAGYERGGNFCLGANRNAGLIVWIPVENAVRQSANGRFLDDSSIVVVKPGAEFCLAARGVAHGWCSLVLPAGLGIVPDRRTGIDSGCRIVRPGAAAVERLRTLVSRIVRIADFDAFPAPARMAAEGEVIAAVRACLEHGGEGTVGRRGRPSVPRVGLVRDTIQRLEAFDGRPSIASLAAEADVAERTLNRAFREVFGIPPVHYRTLFLLDRVRTSLLTAAAPTTVANVLASHGIWEFGRFAGAYRRRFGESPAATLAAALARRS